MTEALVCKENQQSTLQDRPNNQAKKADQTCSPLKENAQNSNQWQLDRLPPAKRKRQESPTGQQSANKGINPLVPTQNRFDILNDENNETENNKKEYVPKPEPIFITGVIDIIPLRDILNKAVNSDKYQMTTLRSGHIIKLIPSDIETYKIIRDYLIEKEIHHYTYKLKSERAYRVVIRGLHASEDISLIKAELQDNGHEVRQVVNVHHRTTKQKLPLYFVDIEQRPNNKDIFNIRHIGQVKVTIEAPYKKREVIQCKRCQRFGHSKNQCFRPFRCVKCGNDHPTATCTKLPETDAVCANCQGSHPASYRGCNKYKEYKERILKIKVKPDSNKARQTIVHTHQPKAAPEEPQPSAQPRSYSDALRHRNESKNLTDQSLYTLQEKQLNDNLTDNGPNITKLLDIMFNRFQEIMKTMMDSMMDRMVQLITGLVSQRA